MKRLFLISLVLGLAQLFFVLPDVCAQDDEEIKPPYSLNRCLLRGEELFRQNNYAEALIFYYEAFQMVKDETTRGKLHFRIGECLEAVRRFDFATWHYQQAVKNSLPDVLASRVIMKLEHLPELAQKEEANRLFRSAMNLYRQRNIREAIDDYLASLRLMPSLMAQDESGLIDDAVKYLTYLSESKEKEPERLLKLATLLELRGDIEKSIETLQQIIIIYPDSDPAQQAEEKLALFNRRRTAYVEPVQPRDAISELAGEPEKQLFQDSFEFRNAGIVSRDLNSFAFTFRAINERAGIPADRFEMFSVTLGKGGEQRDFLFTAEEGIENRDYVFETADIRYTMNFIAVNLTRGYIQDLYGEGRKSVELFAAIRVQLKVERLVN
jgi:tetratricopeptide (TPR) repeat protein